MLRAVAGQLGGELVERAIAIEAKILATSAAIKPDRPLPSNVEFYAGVIMGSVGLPRRMFTPTFAVSRVIGWSAHALEQAAEAKIIRPSSRHSGPELAPVPIERGTSVADRGNPQAGILVDGATRSSTSRAI